MMMRKFNYLKYIILFSLLITFNVFLIPFLDDPRIQLFILISLILLIPLVISSNSTEYFLVFLIFYLPYSPYIRMLFEINDFDLLAELMKYIRDLVIFFIFLIVIIQNKILSNFSNFILKFRVLVILAIPYLFILIVSFFIGLNNGFTLLAIQGIRISVIPFIVFVSISITKSRINYMKVLFLFHIIGLSVTLLSFYFYLSKPLFFGEILSIYFGDISPQVAAIYPRMVGTILSPNIFGTYIAMLVTSSFQMLISSKNFLMKFIFIILTILYLPALFLSMSRGAWLFAFFSFTFLILYYFSTSKDTARKSKYLIYLFFALVFLLLNLSIFFFYFPSFELWITLRLESIFNLSDESSFGRIDTWIQVLKTLNYTNIYGYGLGVGGINLINFPTIVNQIGFNVIDGYYVKIFVESGFIGLFFFLGLFINLILFYLRKLRNNVINNSNRHNVVIIFSISIAIGLMFQSLASNVLDFIVISPIIYLILGLGFNFSIKSPHEINY